MIRVERKKRALYLYRVQCDKVILSEEGGEYGFSHLLLYDFERKKVESDSSWKDGL